MHPPCAGLYGAGLLAAYVRTDAGIPPIGELRKRLTPPHVRLLPYMVSENRE